MYWFPDAAATIEPLLAVADLSRSLAFWEDSLGGGVLVRWENYAVVQIGEGRLHLAVTGEPPHDRAVRLVPPHRLGNEAPGEVVVRVTDCSAVVAELEERGVQFLGPAAIPAWGGEVRAFLHDPDGHLVEISSVRSGSG